VLAATASLFAATVAPPALADGDPASDVLLGQSVFYPYAPAVSPTLMHRLNAETTAAAAEHFPIKVALISSPQDLGVVPSLFGQPQTYAHFLEQEISFQGRPLLLVVMPAGYGVEGLPKPSTAAVGGLPKPRPSGNTSDSLAQAALTAVATLSAAAGHRLPNVPGSATGDSGSAAGGGLSTRTVLLVVLVIAAVATAGALIAVRRRETPGS
jgi:hypothetical protein